MNIGLTGTAGDASEPHAQTGAGGGVGWQTVHSEAEHMNALCTKSFDELLEQNVDLVKWFCGANFLSTDFHPFSSIFNLRISGDIDLQTQTGEANTTAGQITQHFVRLPRDWMR